MNNVCVIEARGPGATKFCGLTGEGRVSSSGRRERERERMWWTGGGKAGAVAAAAAAYFARVLDSRNASSARYPGSWALDAPATKFRGRERAICV